MNVDEFETEMKQAGINLALAIEGLCVSLFVAYLAWQMGEKWAIVAFLVASFGCKMIARRWVEKMRKEGVSAYESTVAGKK